MDDDSVQGDAAAAPPRRALSDISNLRSPRGGKRAGAGRPSSAEAKERKAKTARAVHTSAAERAAMAADHAALINPRGRSLTSGERRMVLALLLSLRLHLNHTATQAVDRVVEWLRVSNNTVYAVWHHWKEERCVGEPMEGVRGGAAASHPNHTSHLTPEQTATLQQTLFAAQQKAKHCSTSLLINELKSKHGIEVRKWTVCRWLRRLGYRWAQSRAVGKMTQQARAARVRAFIQEYAAALQQEKDGKVVVVYTDESFCHTGHHSRRGWFAETNEVQRATGKGKRLILLHAMTRGGLLTKRNAAGVPHPASANVTEAAFNAELVFEGLNIAEDYHKSVNADVFMSWVEHRLIPAYKSLYGNKPMALVLDNAPYHHARPAGWQNPNQMSKLELATWLVDLGVKDVQVERDGQMRTFGLASLFAPRSGKYAPRVEEMRRFMKQHLAAHPHLNRTRLQEVFAQHGYKLIFTPPYTPQVQPIELVWAHVKNYVARQTHAGTDQKALQALVRQGFYGDASTGHEAVGAALCDRLLACCHRWIDAFIAADEDLDGSVMALQVAGEESADLCDDVEEGEEEEQQQEDDAEEEPAEDNQSDEE
jgi:transposase